MPSHQGSKNRSVITRPRSARNGCETYEKEKEQNETEERLKYISHLTSDAIWEWDIPSDKIFRNEKMIKISGNLPMQNKGLSWLLDRVHSQDRDQLANLIKEVTQKKMVTWQSEYRFLCVDGEYRNMLDHGYVIYQKDMPVKMIGSLHDITDKKLMQNLLMEEKLHEYKIVSENTIRVQEQERSRFGRELHDNVNQIVSAIRLYVSMLTPANKKEAIMKEKAIAYCLQAIEEIRRLSRAMITPELDTKSLIENIRTIVEDVETTTGLKIALLYDNDSEAICPGKKVTLFRIVQEQVKNIVKYSKATDAEIRLEIKDGILRLTIKDNGIGFDNRKMKKGVGLSSIRERVKFHNGKVKIVSAPGMGTSVVIQIPIDLEAKSKKAELLLFDFKDFVAPTGIEPVSKV
jgi:PAS domain S-box-containing protein